MHNFLKKNKSSSSQDIQKTVTHQYYETTTETVITHRSNSVTVAYPASQTTILTNKEIPKRPSLFSDRLTTTANDAKLLNPPPPAIPKKINLNYESPYKRGTKAYSSLGHPSTSQHSFFNNTSNNNNNNNNNRNNVEKFTSSTPQLSPSTSKRISVKITGQIYDNRSDPVPCYKTSSNNRGEVLIINNILFKNGEYRAGAELDESNLNELFKQMGFNVKSKRNLTKKQMEKKLKEFSKQSTLKSSDIAIVVIMSHGTNRETLGGYTEIFGSDDEPVVVDDILKSFTNNNCPYMADKPKIFIFQCCRGTEAFIRKDAKPILVKQPELYKDMLIAYSTLPGFASHRDPTTGTWYIQTICDVFSEHAHKLPVEELLKIVNRKLSSIHKSIVQTSTYENRGFDKCYLHPGVSTKKK